MTMIQHNESTHFISMILPIECKLQTKSNTNEGIGNSDTYQPDEVHFQLWSKKAIKLNTDLLLQIPEASLVIFDCLVSCHYRIE